MSVSKKVLKAYSDGKTVSAITLQLNLSVTKVKEIIRKQQCKEANEELKYLLGA